MEDWTAHLPRIVAVGVGATVVMDLWLALLKRLKVPSMNFALVGRWAGHVLRGQWFHDGIAKATPIRGEAAWGWLLHYAIGMAFAALLVWAVGPTWLVQPTALPALAVGVATVVAPLFVMQPAMGSGIAASKTATPVRNCVRSVANHAVFGLGLYIAAWVLNQLI